MVFNKAKRKELILTLITCAPGGTSGDVTSCKKYIEETLANLPSDSEYDIKFNLVITGVYDQETKKRIDSMLGKERPYNLMYASNSSFFQKPDLKQSAAYIFYPSFQIIDDAYIDSIKRSKKPALIVNHYNFQSSTDSRYAAKKRQWIPALYTGFGGQNLGVNIKNWGMKPESVDIPKDDAGVYDFVFGTKNATTLNARAAQKYFKNNALFFGYMNKLAYLESKQNLANPTEFAKLCIAKSQAQSPGKQVDILIRLNDRDNYPEFNYFTQLTEHFEKNHEGLSVSVYKKDDSGQLVLKGTFGDGPTKVRIIDPFPISNASMINMMQLSDPFSMMTGSESLIESLSCNKLPLYQIMNWHDLLYTELLNEVKLVIGPQSLLYQYFKLQNKNESKSPEAGHKALLKFLLDHEPQLLAELRRFNAHLLKNRQLKTHLHSKIIDLVTNPEAYIHQCLSVNCLHFDDEPELTGRSIDKLPQSIIQLFEMYPNKKEIIFKDTATLMAAIVRHENGNHAAKNIRRFVEGYKALGDNDAALFNDILRQVTPEVKVHILSAEFELLQGTLDSLGKAIQEKYSHNKPQGDHARLQLTQIQDAKISLMAQLKKSKTPEQQQKAIDGFYGKIDNPVKVLDKLLGKNVLAKCVELFIKSLCALLVLPVVLVMSISVSGRERLQSFFSDSPNAAQRDLRKIAQVADDYTDVKSKYGKS